MLKSYIAFDLETTGLSPQEHEIIEIGDPQSPGRKGR